jgi:putative ABC transport system permease protein
MLGARWHKILNDLWRNKLRTALIVLSIAVGLFAMGTIVSARAILATEMARDFAAINPSHGIVRTVQPFDRDFVRAVAAMDEVAAVDARRVLEVRAEIAPGEWMTLRLFAVEEYEDMTVDIVRPIRGAWPPPAREILIERSALPLLNTGVGDTLRIEMPSEQQRELRVSGVVHDLVQVPASFDGTPYGYIHMDTLTWLGEPYGLNELHVVAADAADEAAAQQAVNAVKTKAEKNGLSIPISLAVQPGQLPLDDILQVMLLLMGIIGLLTLFLSAFLIINTVSALLAQQKRQIGVMKALGADSRQLIGMYLVMVLVYGVLALLLAVPLSSTGARRLSGFLASLFNFDLLDLTTPATAVLLQIAVGLLVPVLASLYPFLANLRVAAADAMSDLGTASAAGRPGRIDRLLSGANLWFARQALSRPWLLSLRNTFRSKWRLGLTLTTLTLTGALFMSVFSVQASLESTADAVLSWWRFDTMISLERPYRTAQLAQKAAQVDGVVATGGWLQFPVYRQRPDGSESHAIMLLAIDPASPLTPSPTVVEGRELRPDDTNAVILSSNVRQDEPDLEVGDAIVLEVDGQERPFTVVGFSVGVLSSMAFAPYGTVSHISGDAGQATTGLVALQRHDPAFVNATAAALERHLKQAGIRVNSVQTILEEREEVDSAFNILIRLLLFMAALLGLVGGLGLMGTMSINVLERTREIGVLRAIGASNQGVATVFIREGIAIGLLSWLLGLVCAFPMSKLLSDAVGIPLTGSPLVYSFSPTGVWLWLLLVVLLSIVATFVPARNASRLTVREVLAYE